MIVVADTSPFVALIKIGHVHILSQLFVSVVVPPEVMSELLQPNMVKSVRTFAATPPDWLEVKQQTHIAIIADLHVGESAAINLAEELRADLLLIDERLGYEVAKSRKIRTARTAAVIKQAADSEFISDLRDAFDRLLRTDFRVPKKVLDDLLADHLRRRAL